MCGKTYRRRKEKNIVVSCQKPSLPTIFQQPREKCDISLLSLHFPPPLYFEKKKEPQRFFLLWSLLEGEGKGGKFKRSKALLIVPPPPAANQPPLADTIFCTIMM